LEMLLNSDDPECKFPGDINAHVTDMTPLMCAVQAGQVEAVELMIKAGADPHMKCRVPLGKDPGDGENAREIAAKCGWDDIVAILQKAEKDVPPHKYKRYGKENNSRLVVLSTGETGDGYKDPLAAMKRADYVPGQQKVRAQVLPKTSIGLLFPGQGSQYVKMIANLKDLQEVKDMSAKAKVILGYDLLQLCLDGPESKLEETQVCQPAMFFASMAGLVKLRQTRPEAVERPGAVAGLSLGEYSALCAAGVFSFEDGMELVKVRGAAMAAAARSREQVMLSVAGMEQEALEESCAEFAKDGEVCQIANILFPKGFSCAGTKKAMEKLKDAVMDRGAMQAKFLKTGGAFHTSLMEPAREELEAKLQELLPRMQPPKVDIYMNVTGQRIKAGTPPKDIVPLLARQLVSVVQWEPSVRMMIRQGLSEFYEVGPMKQLKAMMKRIDQNAWGQTTNVEV